MEHFKVFVLGMYLSACWWKRAGRGGVEGGLNSIDGIMFFVRKTLEEEFYSSALY
jgi:hypothetical protein